MGVEAVIDLYNKLYGAEFPKNAGLMDLANHVRKIQGLLSMSGQATAHNFNEVIWLALMEAFSMGLESADYKPTAEETAEFTNDPRTKRLLRDIQHMGIKSDLMHAIEAHVGLNWCVQHSMLRPGRSYYLIVRSCLECGKHEHSYPDLGTEVSREFFFKFCVLHAVCGGV